MTEAEKQERVRQNRARMLEKHSGNRTDWVTSEELRELDTQIVRAVNAIGITKFLYTQFSRFGDFRDIKDFEDRLKVASTTLGVPISPKDYLWEVGRRLSVNNG